MAAGGGRPHLSVVIPAYNEEGRLGDTLTAIHAYLDARRLAAEVLVVDDGSTDDTARHAELALRGRQGRVLRSPLNRGKGEAFRRGVLAARGRWVLLTDADLSTPIDEHERLARTAREHDCDVVIGSRALPGSRVEVRQNVVRESMGKSFNAFIRLATRLPFRDTQCGFKLMDRNRVLPIVRTMVVDGFAFDVELLFLCVRFGLTVRDVPVLWRNSPDSRVSIAGDPFAMLVDVLRMRWRFRTGGYRPDAVEPA